MIVIESNIEYIQLFMEYESDDMPMVYFYEVDLNDERLALRDRSLCKQDSRAY